MDFNAEQLTAIQSQERNLLVLAGAGTGKTRTIIGRARHLIQTGTDPKRIAIVTFTRRAANEIRSRLLASSGTAAGQIPTGTFHNLCLRIMTSRRKWFGYSDMTIMDRDDQLQLMKLVRGELVGKDATIPQAATLLNYYSFARNTNQAPEHYLRKFTSENEESIQTLIKIFGGYKARKKANSYLDYDDILHRFAKVLHDNAEVRERIASQFDHVLVDEMQDTNPLQWLILESLSQHASLFCVGDDAQSIYAFRGADFENVHSFDERLPDGCTLKLEKNYRSTQPILDVANWLLTESKLGYDKHLEAARGNGIKPLLLDFDSEFDEAKWIVTAIEDRRVQGADWSNHMILCRTAFSARPIEAQLIERKIPYRFVGGIGLLQMAHVKDLLSLLRVLINHHDELAWMRYLTLWPRIGDVRASRLLQQIVQENSIEQALDRLTELMKDRAEIIDPLNKVFSKVNNPAAAIDHAIELLEPMMSAKYDRWDTRIKDLKLLSQLAANHRSLPAFLETYTLDPISASEASPAEDLDAGIVTLITVHSAKGTEAETCFVAAAQPGNYPHSRSQDDDEIEEERRVLYVALTRAKDELIVTRSLRRGYARMSWNSAQGSHYFLQDLPPAFVDWSPKLLESSYTYDDDDVI